MVEKAGLAGQFLVAAEFLCGSSGRTRSSGALSSCLYCGVSSLLALDTVHQWHGRNYYRKLLLVARLHSLKAFILSNGHHPNPSMW